MADEEQKKIFVKNLNRYLELFDKTQKEVADSIGVSPQTFNTWCQGIALPRMGKVQLLADYFGISKSDLIDETKNSIEIDERLLTSYNQLNGTGKEKVIEYASDLSHNPRYTAVTTLHETSEYHLNAAHEDGATPEQKTAADDIMMDDSEWE